MNHVFKIIWNTVNQCWIAVSELSKSVGKSSQTDKRKALNVIIGAAVLAGVSTTAMAETNVVSNDQGNIVGGIGATALAGTGTTGNSVVLGNKAKSETTESVVIGGNTTNTGRWSVTLGDKADGNSQYGVTIGDRASTGKGGNAIAIGLMAKTSNEKAGGNSQTAVGAASYADGEAASAFGANANATGSTATAIGRAAKALAQSASALGDSASASAWGATALGVGASARANNSIAVGSAAVTEGQESTALGRRSYAGAQSATALGTLANASAIVSTAVGNGAKARASGSDALASGSNANASSINAVAVGKDSNSSAVNSIALGTSSNVSAVSAVVIGTQAKGTHENSVTLGSYSSSAANDFNQTAKALSYFGDKSSVTVKYNGTSSTQKGAVSVGDGKLVRQIQNVGAGRITAESNDAVNGSQLYQAYYNAGFNIQNNDTDTSRINTNGKVNFVNGKNTEVVVEDGENAANITVNLKDDINVKSVKANNITVGPVTINDKDGINAGNTKITNVSNGTISADSKEAVNGSQLYAAKNELNTNITKAAAAAKTEVKAGTNVEVTSETGANNQTIYTVNAKDTSASVEAGSDAITVTVGGETTKKDGLSVTTVTNYKVDLSQKTKDEIKNAAGRGFNVTASASEGTVVNEVTEETVQSTATKMDKLTLDAGKNIKLTHKKGKVLSVAVSDTPTFKNVTTKGDLNVGGTVHAHGGLDVHNNRIVNVADPKDPTDAVNKRYVDNAVKNINNNINRLDNKIDHVDRKLRAGIAGATAISFLQRPNEAGKSLVSVGVGGYRNENALAVGYGRNSDNNKVSIKVGASINSRSDVNWGGSIGYQW